MTAADWNRQVSRCEDQNFLHFWEYAETKCELEAWAVERGLFIEAGEIRGMVQILLKQIPLLGRGLAWINRGPLCLTDNGQENKVDPSKIGQMLKLLVARYVDEQGNYLRIGPNLHNSSDLGKMIEGAAMQRTATPGWASAKVDLAPPVAEIRKVLDGKWRDCLNKGQKSGFSVETGTQGKVFEDFLTAHEKLHRDKQLQTNFDNSFISRLQDKLTGEDKMTAIVAYRDGAPIGSALFAKYGSTGEYLAGNSTDAGRHLNSGQVLLWRGLEELKAKGCRWLDLGGMDPELTPKGIFHFKSGLNGEAYRLHNEIESINPRLLAPLVRFRLHLRSRGQSGSVPR